MATKDSLSGAAVTISSIEKRVHWLRVLEADPDHREARARLGYRLIDGRWYVPEEVRMAREQTQDLRRRLLKWMPILKSVIAGCRARDLKQRTEAFEKLAELEDSDAIPALEVTALQADDDLAPLLVQSIAKTETLEAATGAGTHCRVRCVWRRG